MLAIMWLFSNELEYFVTYMVIFLMYVYIILHLFIIFHILRVNHDHKERTKNTAFYNGMENKWKDELKVQNAALLFWFR